MAGRSEEWTAFEGGIPEGSPAAWYIADHNLLEFKGLLTESQPCGILYVDGGRGGGFSRVVRYQPKTRLEAQKELEPFEPSLYYGVYLKKAAGGGKTVVLASKGSSFKGGAYGPQYVDTFEVAGGAIVDRQVHRAELLEYRPLGLISGHGANLWAKTREDIFKLIDLYGTRARRKSLWKRIKSRLGFD